MDGSSGSSSSRRRGLGFPPIPPSSNVTQNFVSPHDEQPFDGSDIPNSYSSDILNANIDVPEMVMIPNPPVLPSVGDETQCPEPEEINLDPEPEIKLDPMARAARRRVANREYSYRYRMKQQVHKMDLENRQKILKAEILEKSPQVQFYREVKSSLVAEHISLQDQLSEISADLELKNAEAEILSTKLNELQMEHEAKMKLISDMKDSKGKGKGI